MCRPLSGVALAGWCFCGSMSCICSWVALLFIAVGCSENKWAGAQLKLLPVPTTGVHFHQGNLQSHWRESAESEGLWM